MLKINIILVNGKWSEWSTYSECSKTCAGGTKTRTRECNNPPKKGSGRDCVGDAEETITCGTDTCPGKPIILLNTTGHKKHFPLLRIFFFFSIR